MFIIFWRGQGWWVPVITLGLGGGVGALGESAYPNSDWPAILGAAAAAIVLWFVGKGLNTGDDWTIRTEPLSGKQVAVSTAHSFMFIPVEYWALIVGAGALIGGFSIFL